MNKTRLTIRCPGFLSHRILGDAWFLGAFLRWSSRLLGRSIIVKYTHRQILAFAGAAAAAVVAERVVGAMSRPKT